MGPCWYRTTKLWCISTKWEQPRAFHWKMGSLLRTVDLSSYLDNTTFRQPGGWRVFSWMGTTSSCHLEDDEVCHTQTVDLSSYLDNTDNQVADVFQLNRNNLELSLEDDEVCHTNQWPFWLFGQHRQPSGWRVSVEWEQPRVVILENDGVATPNRRSFWLLGQCIINISGLRDWLKYTDHPASLVELPKMWTFPFSTTRGPTTNRFPFSGNIFEPRGWGSVDLSGIWTMDNQNISGSPGLAKYLTIGISRRTSEGCGLSVSTTGDRRPAISLSGQYFWT